MQIEFTARVRALRSLMGGVAAAGIWLGVGMTTGVAKEAWKPIPPEDLAATKPQLESEVPAEVLLWTVDVNDLDFPEQRVTTEYIRYKIYDSQKAEKLARISSLSFSQISDRNEVSAKLTLPDGKTKEFGKESIKERSFAKQAREEGFFGWLSGSNAELKEKFLAIPGIESGAILEYQFKRVEPVLIVTAFVAQREGMPVRQYDFTMRTAQKNTGYGQRTFLFNEQNAKMTQDPKTRALTVHATGLPPIVVEPVMGPATDYAMTILCCYDNRDVALMPRSDNVPVPGKVDAKFGPWAFYSTVTNWYERDRGWPTKRVQQLAGEITAGAKDDTDKARLVHDYVRGMVQRWLKKTVKPPMSQRAPRSLDDVLNWEKDPAVFLTVEEFLFLAVALDKAAGLDAHTILLPNRQLARFYRENVSPLFLPFYGVAIKIGDEWRFSAPHNSYALPFGMLPWNEEGQLGLLALDRKEEFIKVPATSPKQSLTTSVGSFEIDREGTLDGTVRRTFTGHTAAFVRAQLQEVTGEKRDEVAKSKFGFDLKTVEFTITDISSLTETEKPVEITGKLHWPGYAVLTKDRMVVRTAVFRTEAKSPFSAEQRRHPIHFPYRWSELDRISIRLPDNYAPEAPVAPAPLPGEFLSAQTQIGYEQEKNTVHVLREFSSSLMDVPEGLYPKLRNWYAAVDRVDRHELVFSKKAPDGAEKADK